MNFTYSSLVLFDLLLSIFIYYYMFIDTLMLYNFLFVIAFGDGELE
jgi:hypothetical protein